MAFPPWLDPHQDHADGARAPCSPPSEFVEAARHLSRTREQVRGDLMSARHRVSKLLLAHGRVYEGTTTWNRAHRLWLGAQRFEQPPTELASSICSPPSTG